MSPLADVICNGSDEQGSYTCKSYYVKDQITLKKSMGAPV